MKKLFPLLLLFLLLASCAAHTDRFTGTDGRAHCFYDNKKTVYVGFATLGCHDCHVKLNEYLEKEGFYDNPDIELYGLISLEPEQMKSELAQKIAVSDMLKYYPKMQRFRFCKQIGKGAMKVGSFTVNSFNTPFLFVAREKTFNQLIGAETVIVFEGKNIAVNKNLKLMLGM